MNENAVNRAADCQLQGKQQIEQRYAAAGLMQGVAMGECARQSAKGVLRDKVRRLRMEADRLEALAGALPEKLPHDADGALWSLLIAR